MANRILGQASPGDTEFSIANGEKPIDYIQTRVPSLLFICSIEYHREVPCSKLYDLIG